MFQQLAHVWFVNCITLTLFVLYVYVTRYVFKLFNFAWLALILMSTWIGLTSLILTLLAMSWHQ